MGHLPHRAAAQTLRFIKNTNTNALLFPLPRSSLLPSRPCTLNSTSTPSLSSPFNLHRSFLPGCHSKPFILPGVCFATNPGSPLPESDPPPDLEASFSKVQDRMQIFFAVLFWMSLFFWNCVWDGRNDDRPDKGSQFRK